MDDRRAGAALRALRRRRGLRQVDIARKAGVDQTTVSRIERGRLDTLTVRRLRLVYAAVDARFDPAVTWRAGDLDRVLDERHAALCGLASVRLSRCGWEVHPEVTFSIYGERGSVDLLASRSPDRAVLVVEVKSELVSVEETLRRLDVKARLAPRIARERLGLASSTVGRALVLPDSGSTRAALRRHDSVIGAALPGRGVEVRAWLIRPTGSLSAVWLLPGMRPGTATRGSAALHRMRVPAVRARG